MRDALIAAINLNLFNENCDRVKMANIAQVVNVLQAVILTEGDKMVLTPTYHVFEMYRHHQDATLIDSELIAGTIETTAGEIPALTKSVSVDAKGIIHITLGNADAEKVEKMEITLGKKEVTGVSSEMIKGAVNAMNTFEHEAVSKEELSDLKFDGSTITLTLPACSVVHLAIEQ